MAYRVEDRLEGVGRTCEGGDVAHDCHLGDTDPQDSI